MNENWNLKIKNQSDLEKDLMVKEIMKLRRQCSKMYDALKVGYLEFLDLYETPEKELRDRVDSAYQRGKSLGIIIGHIEVEQKF